MATVTDVEVANASFPTVRQDLNDILEAIATNFSADAEPTTTYANQWWYETDTNKLYIRNEDNDAWIHVLTLDQTTDTIASVEGAGGDKIEEGNSSVEVIDTGAGYIQFNVDGAEIARIDSDGMKFGDNEKAIFGAGSDLQIYHNGSYSAIQDSGTGDLWLAADASVNISNAALSEYKASFTTNGAVTLYYDNASKFTTTNSGATIYGDMALSSSGAVNSELRSDFAGLQIGTTSNHYLALRSNNTERIRIDTSGFLLVNRTSGLGTSKLVVEADTTTENPVTISNSRSSSATDYSILFYRNGSIVGSVQTSLTSTTYATSSDYRLKENVVDMTGAIDRVKALKPSQFNFIADPDDTTVDGFLAHEVKTVVPEAVTGEKDAMTTEEYEVSPALGEIYAPATEDADEQIVSFDVEQPETLEEGQQWRETTPAVMGTREVPDYQGIDQSKLVPLLTGALKEAIAKIEALEARVTALES